MSDENNGGSPPDETRQKRPYQKRVPRYPYGKARLTPRIEEEEPQPKPSIFEGMTGKRCADACYRAGTCVITGDICAHPHTSGGLQAVHKTRQYPLKHYDEAVDYLRHQAIEQRRKA